MFSWDILTCRINSSRLWFHLHSYWNFIFRTIWVSQLLFLVYHLVLKYLLVSSNHRLCRWKISFISNTVCDIRCFTVFSWNILTCRSKFIRLWFHFNRYWNFIFHCHLDKSTYCSGLSPGVNRIYWCLPMYVVPFGDLLYYQRYRLQHLVFHHVWLEHLVHLV